MKLTTHKELHEKWMKDPEYRVDYEEEIRKERLQETLQKWQEYAGLTHQEIAKIIGVNPSTVSIMESNDKYVGTLYQSMWSRVPNNYAVKYGIIIFYLFISILWC
ncbi:hypothetical protein PXH59_18175 [Xenorhabdus sp. SF857]|uniref:hypothetical protein n=1 Tax=Xenorhabdus bakwenae TaxID=3026967 RepID=UPI002557CC8C|nr:hypothetical protein [Xenorhabdus sp. SF857]WFQ79461.1 hypothetical protein PXH59_18175 [Xenorhabdus sp. SF857]